MDNTVPNLRVAVGVSLCFGQCINKIFVVLQITQQSGDVFIRILALRHIVAVSIIAAFANALNALGGNRLFYILIFVIIGIFLFRLRALLLYCGLRFIGARLILVGKLLQDLIVARLCLAAL